MLIQLLNKYLLISMFIVLYLLRIPIKKERNPFYLKLKFWQKTKSKELTFASELLET